MTGKYLLKVCQVSVFVNGPVSPGKGLEQNGGLSPSKNKLSLIRNTVAPLKVSISNCFIVDFKLFASAVKCPFPINLEVMKLFLYLSLSSVVSVQDLLWVTFGSQTVQFTGG